MRRELNLKFIIVYLFQLAFEITLNIYYQDYKDNIIYYI